MRIARRTMGRLGSARRGWALSACAVMLAFGAAATHSGGGAAARRASPRKASVAVAAPAGQNIEPAVCSDCIPPLGYAGGPVAGTHSSAGLVVVPIYWAPSDHVFPPRFESTIDRFIANVAAARGSTDNVFSVATEYYSDQFGIKSPVRNAIAPAPSLDDSGPFPHSGCKPLAGFTTCITDNQLRAELRRLIRTRRLATDLAHLYAVFLPPGVETTSTDRSNSVEGFCAYHASFASGDGWVLYANQPFDESKCGSDQAPTGNVAADNVIAVLSHEVIEVITDPIDEPHAWADKTGHEMADMCADTYGRPLGSTSRADPAGSEYNQIIHGGRYYLPQEFSNLAFERFGPDRGCVLSERIAHSATAAAIGKLDANPRAFVVDAAPTALRADAKATSRINVRASGSAGNGLSGDHVHFTVDADSGSGRCGTLSSDEQATSPDGRASVTYTASKDDVACWVLAVDTEGGRSSEAAIYQGKAAKDSPTLRAAFPAALQAGGGPKLFTVTAANPSRLALPETITHFVIFAGGSGARGVRAGQVHLSYSAKGPNGRFIPIPLAGSTDRGNAIQGYIGSLRGTVLPPRSSEKLTLRISIDRGVPVSKAAPLMTLHAYLDQTNPAAGSDATVADSNETSVTVPTAASSHTLRNVLIAVGVVLVLLASTGLLLWRRRRMPPHVPSPQKR